MVLYRLIAPEWLMQEQPSIPRVREGEFTNEELVKFNGMGYNIYMLPNRPSLYDKTRTLDGSQIDKFEYVFIDMDLKDGVYKSKEEFLEVIGSFPLTPTTINDSGNGIHVYWRITDLDAMTYLRLSRRLMRRFKTDEAVGQIFQLMRAPNTVNNKDPENPKLSECWFESGKEYQAEQLDQALDPISPQDEAYCQNHYNKTYHKEELLKAVDEKIPLKFTHLLRNNTEVKGIWTDVTDDRSKGDYRLGHIMWGNGFTKEEATSVLVNSAKALERSPTHRLSYAMNIVDKIWTYESEEASDDMSESVEQILKNYGSEIKGTRFPCHRYIDNTLHGFRLGQVIGLVAGSGVGKTSISLNIFKGFVANNVEHDHFFVSLEQPRNEIAERWAKLCGTDTHLHSKVHVLSNYDKDGSFRNLSLQDIQDHILKFKKKTNRPIGCIVIDHIGILAKNSKNGENQGLIEICRNMKAFAVATNSMLIMQSQAPREKAGIGDLELNKDAAYGTAYFEFYCDYLITLWQPLKRCYTEGAPFVTAYKFCKIRHKNQAKDLIKEDVKYALIYDVETGELRELTQEEQKSLTYHQSQANKKRNQDKKEDIIPYVSLRSNECEKSLDGSAQSVSPSPASPKLGNHTKTNTQTEYH